MVSGVEPLRSGKHKSLVYARDKLGRQDSNLGCKIQSLVPCQLGYAPKSLVTFLSTHSFYNITNLA